MDYKVDGKDIIIKQEDFDLDDTLDCGQAFRWNKIDRDTYQGYFFNTPLLIKSENKKDGIFRLYNTNEDELKNIWCSYFDFETDYGSLKKRFAEDETLSKACEYAGGIRILKQNSWEALSSFIISQNNNIPRIKGIIGRLCDHYNSYPEPAKMASETVESLSYLRSGFRAKYIIDAVSKVNSGELNLEHIKSMPIEDARKALMSIKGVGPKVAECVLLFGMYRTEAFPIDVWVKRVMERWYPNGLPECTKGFEGIAQQYLFHYIRTNRLDESI
ncbi:MAG: DNA-3-methyladenine glycosylase family protein [Oscillospiraceae bacterium]